MKRLICLLLAAALLALAGCQREEPAEPSGVESGGGLLSSAGQEGPSEAPLPEDSSQEEPNPEPPAPLPARTPEDLPALPPAPEAPALPEGTPRIAMAVQEYHPRKDIVGCGCIVEIPRLEGEGPGIPEVNAAAEALQKRWEEFLNGPPGAGHGDGDGPSMEARTLPYSNGKWVQAVVHYIFYPNYAYRGDTLSLNYSLEEGRGVTVEEMMENLSVTPQQLMEKLEQQDLSQVLFYFDYPAPRLLDGKVQAFRAREDGSVVFYLWVEVLPKEDLDEDHRVVTYDTRDGSFAEFWGNYPDSFLEPPNRSDPPLQWERDLTAA